MANLECHGFRWKMHRMVERLVDFVAKQTEKPYPQTNAALLSLQRAMANELPMARRSKTKRRTAAAGSAPARSPRKRNHTDFDRVAKKQYDKCRRVEKKNEVCRPSWPSTPRSS